METNYPKSRRSKRKLCYLNERSSNHWGKPSSLIDADRLFDDIDVCADLYPTCAALQSSDSGTNQSVTSGPSVLQEKRLTENSPVLQILSSSSFKPVTLNKIINELDDDVFQSATRSQHLKLDLDLDIPFKAHNPVKTSSPIEQNMCRKSDDESSNVFPILFDCEAETAEEPDENPPNTQKPQCNGRVRDNSDGERESSPSRVALNESFVHKEEVKASCQDQTEPSVLAERPESDGSAVKIISFPKQSPTETFSRSGRDMTTFLQKVKQLIQSKPPKNSAVKAPRLPPPPPPEPEEDFFILEDDAPLWVSIPSKSSTKNRQKLSKTSSSEKESFTEREIKDSSVDTPQEQQQEPEKANNNPESQVVVQKTNNRKKSSKKNTESENNKESLPGPEDFPDPVEQQEPKKKKQQKKVSSKGSDETKDHPAGDPEEQQEEKKIRLKVSSKGSSEDENHPGDPEEQEEPTKKKQRKKSKESNKTKDVPAGDPKEQQEEKKKRLKASLKQSSKDEDHPGDPEEQVEPTKKKQWKKFSSKGSDEAEDPESRASVEAENSSHKTEPNKLKSTRRKTLKEGKEISPTIRTDSLQKSRKQLQGSTAVTSGAGDVNQEQGDEEPAGTEHLGSFSDKEADREPKQKQSAESGESSPEDILCRHKRKRRPTGQWWLTSLSTEEAGNPLSSKNFKQKNNREPSTALSSKRVKKDKNNKKRVQKQPVSLSSDHEDERKKSKGKQPKKRKTKGEKVKETGEINNTAEEQQENPDQEESSPLVFAHRDLSLNSGGRIFHQVYHHSPSENMSVTSTAAEEDQPREPEPEPAKRTRKPPSNWWEVNSVSGSASSQPQQLQQKEPKPKKEQKKQSKQKSGLGNMAAGSRPPGGAPVPLLMPLSSPKTVKRSLATFKDIFTSGVETPTVGPSKDTRQSNRRRVSSRPAEKEAELVTGGRADRDGLCGDAGECSGTQHNHKAPLDSACQAEDTLKALRSGPSSLIDLETFEEDDSDLPKSRAQVALSASDLCAPPLKPLTLHSKDKSDLTKWFQSLWSSTADDDAVITPEHFQWYFYKDRALGIQADLNSSSICHGKILMGSYMKKPLWVDHSATTVFNLLTSSVSVTVDGSVSRYSPGQAFMVECGRAYSIHNTNAQPAVLYFTRISAESSD